MIFGEASSFQVGIFRHIWSNCTIIPYNLTFYAFLIHPYLRFNLEIQKVMANRASYPGDSNHRRTLPPGNHALSATQKKSPPCEIAAKLLAASSTLCTHTHTFLHIDTFLSVQRKESRYQVWIIWWQNSVHQQKAASCWYLPISNHQSTKRNPTISGFCKFHFFKHPLPPHPISPNGYNNEEGRHR